MVFTFNGFIVVFAYVVVFVFVVVTIFTLLKNI